MEPGEKPAVSNNLKAASARLAAVQVIYEATYGLEPVEHILRRHAGEHAGQYGDGELLAEPDLEILGSTVRGVHERRVELEDLIRANMSGKGGEGAKETEPLLQSILLAGTYEILAHHKIDTPIIINDYLNVTHAFYEKGEVGLVNGILDAIAGVLRSAEA
ncbi:MAG: transcription antitermination protein NusB [Alphaproteobacteria bacterium]|nr:transcription antitermination protein NusB [Alphaproteobacteria bacterium]